jgi:hypothetical protein
MGLVARTMNFSRRNGVTSGASGRLGVKPLRTKPVANLENRVIGVRESWCNMMFY